MRKSLIGVMALGLVGAVALSGLASADVTKLTNTAQVSPAKQFKKKRGAVSVFYVSEDTHEGTTIPPGGPGCTPTGVTPSCKYFPPSTRSVITFPTDFKFTPGTIPDCNLASLVGKDQAGAQAACPKSVVGTGSAINHTLTEAGTPPGNTGTITGKVTAFNGAPSGGNPTLYLHVDVQGSTTKPILTGVIRGNVLDISVPITPGVVIEHFDTTINKKVSKKTKNKSTGKVTKTFYLAAKCSKKSWTTSQTNTYSNGKQLSSTSTQACKQKK
jgi:hypothetical protein